MDLSVLDLLAAGGNLSMMALLYVMWRFDRRLVVIETELKAARDAAQHAAIAALRVE